MLRIPKAIGPYEIARSFDNLVFTSGQIPISPLSGEIVCDDVIGQTRQAMDNLKAVLESKNSNLDMVLKTTVLLTDLKDFELMNETYREYFNGRFPARTSYEVVALPMGAKIEIDAIAYVNTD